MNLDKLKSDIANNEICILVNGQPETVDFKQWCKKIADNLYSKGFIVTEYDVRGVVRYISNGGLKIYLVELITPLLDY